MLFNPLILKNHTYSGVGGLVVKSCSTLATAWTVACRAPLSMGFPGKNTGVGCHFLLQLIFLTQSWNPGLLHYRQSPYQLSYKGSQSHIHCVTNYPDGSAGKESTCNVGDRGDAGSTPGWRRSPGCLYPQMASEFTHPLIKKRVRDFPGNPAVKIPHFHMQGPCVQPLVPACCEVWPKNKTKIKKKKKTVNNLLSLLGVVHCFRATCI